jgi:hypothetical protein
MGTPGGARTADRPIRGTIVTPPIHPRSATEPLVR